MINPEAMPLKATSKITPCKLSPYCPTDHGKDLEGLIHFVTNILILLPNSLGSHQRACGVDDVGGAGGGEDGLP